MRRDLICGVGSFLFGLFAIPVLVLTGGSLLVGAFLSLVALVAGLVGVGSDSRGVRALAISGFAMGVGGPWYTITGWAVGLNIAASIESLF